MKLKVLLRMLPLVLVLAFCRMPNALFAGADYSGVNPIAGNDKFNDACVMTPGFVSDSGMKRGISTEKGEVINHNGDVIGVVGCDRKVYDSVTKERLRFIDQLSTVEKNALIAKYLYASAKKNFGEACQANNGEVLERITAGVQDENGVFRAVRIDDGRGTSKEVRIDYTKLLSLSKTGKIIFLDHNHPIGACGAWPSNADADEMIRVKKRLGYPVDFYITDCRNVNGDGDDKLLTRLSSTEGTVWSVSEDGTEKLQSQCPSNCIKDDKSLHGAFDPTKFADRMNAIEKNHELKDSTDLGSVTSVEKKEVVKQTPVGTGDAVGIRGWCKCLEKQETSGARSVEVGDGEDWFDKPGYSYRFCLRCGKCRCPLEKFSNVYDITTYDIKIFDREFQWKMQRTDNDEESYRLVKEHLVRAGIKCGDGDTMHEMVAAMAVAQFRLMQIPDGQIVIPGECTCATPDTLQDGFRTAVVCINCGKYSKRQVIGPRAKEFYQYEHDRTH